MRGHDRLWQVTFAVLLGAFLALSMLPGQPAVGQVAREVVVVVKIAGIPWFNRMGTGVEKAGKELGIKASLVGPSTADAAPQVALVEDLVNRGVGAIGVTPTDAKALEPVFGKARQRGIAILTHESPFETSAIDYDVEAINSDSYARLAVDEMVRGLKAIGANCTTANPCGFVMLVGGLTVPLHNYWADQAQAYVKKNLPTLRELTTRLPTAESVEDSRLAVLDLSKTYGDKLNAVIGWGSLGPIGAAAAVREKGLKNKVVVGGSAIPSTAEQYLADGTMKWAQLWDPADAGFALVSVGKQIIDKKKIVTGMQIPGIGTITLKGKVIAANKIVLMRSAADAKKAGF